MDRRSNTFDSALDLGTLPMRSRFGLELTLIANFEMSLEVTLDERSASKNWDRKHTACRIVCNQKADR